MTPSWLVARSSANGIPLVYYPFNGVPIAMRTSDGTLNYLHHDRLGSLVSVSDTSGAEVAWARYYPFGQLRLSGGVFPTDRLFTGQVRDLDDDRLYFYQSRHYDASVGRFLQADTTTPDWKNPQSVNPFTYALNNPVRFSDPSGHFTEDQLKALGYAQAQINAWRENAPEWAAILAAARLGDVVTGLYPFTSGAPIAVQGTFTVLPPHALSSGVQLVLAGTLGLRTLTSFGRVVQSPTLWRPTSQAPGIGSGPAFQIVQTPHVFIHAPSPHELVPGRPSLRQVIYPFATVAADVLGVLDPTSASPLTGHDTDIGIGLSSAYAVALHRLAPSLVSDADILVLASEGVAFLYDRLYQAIYGSEK